MKRNVRLSSWCCACWGCPPEPTARAWGCPPPRSRPPQSWLINICNLNNQSTHIIHASLYRCVLLYLMLNKSQPVPTSVAAGQCVTRRQYFNYLRNDSHTMQGVLSWGQFEQPAVDVSYQQTQLQQSAIEVQQPEDASAKQKRNVSFDTTQNVTNSRGRTQQKMSTSQVKKAASTLNSSVKVQERARSAAKPQRRTKGQDEDEEIRRRIRQRQLEEEEGNKVERREKVEKYIEELKPYTRSLTNTKYQEYFGKSAMEAYGRANTKNAIGGIIYGNHQKTFNLNPHSKGNEPKHYQTHHTAINYGRRTKLNDEDKWRRLEKELTKKLGLKDKNETLKEGKEVVYVDVDQSNMSSIMKENLAFKKEHDAEIRQLEKDYKAEVDKEKKEAVEAFLEAKRQRAMSNNTVDSQVPVYNCPRDEKGRLQEQVVYRMTDKAGNVRLGADRHALTCFVDMNFPENSAAYTEELKNRLAIYPEEVADKDKYIDEQRRENYQKSLDSVYPSHYLLPNCDQPELLKMYQEQGEAREEVHGKTDSLAATRTNNSSLVAH